MPLAEVRGALYGPDRQVRAQAYSALQRFGEEYGHVYAACLNSIKGEGIALSKLRGFSSVRDFMLHTNRMDGDTLGALLGAVEKLLPPLRRYLTARAALTAGRRGAAAAYDILAPLGQAGPSVSYSEAAERITGVLARIDPSLGAFIRNAFEKGWVDAAPRPLKQSGGIAFPVEKIRQSRVLMTFSGALPDLLTVAHELGHAWHDRCSFPVPLTARDAPTPVCETASTFQEICVMEDWLGGSSGEERIFALDSILQSAVRLTTDIYARYLFEDEVIRRRPDGPLSCDELNRIMLSSQISAYGEAIDPGTAYPFGWMNKVHAYIPDFHYYSYPYAFGYLFSRALYVSRGNTEGFFRRYCDMLTASCTSTVEECAAAVGIDVTEGGSFDGVVGDIAAKADEFAALVRRKERTSRMR